MFISSFFACLCSLIIRKDVYSIWLIDTNIVLVLSEGGSLIVRQKQESLQSHEGHVPTCVSPQLHFPTAFDIRRHSLHYLQQGLPMFSFIGRENRWYPNPRWIHYFWGSLEKLLELHPKATKLRKSTSFPGGVGRGSGLPSLGQLR